ncbi:MAG: hypothetical protein KatS3mg014_2151 [Actinomycetota bacterium]|nr:MAG: hypothetical protein KatS3mg014_2151 [Actinomycetota bacterium]
MSGRMREAMCITHVPSAWKAEAIAMRSMPDSRSAQRRISSAEAVSNRSLSSASSSSLMRVCIVVPDLARPGQHSPSGTGSGPARRRYPEAGRVAPPRARTHGRTDGHGDGRTDP